MCIKEQPLMHVSLIQLKLIHYFPIIQELYKFKSTSVVPRTMNSVLVHLHMLELCGVMKAPHLTIDTKQDQETITVCI